jgi:hypothetical protein
MERTQTLNIRKPFGATLVLGVVFMLLIAVIFEIAARNDAVRNALPAPGLGSPHRQFEIQVERLRVRAAKDGNPDCIILGNSQVLRGINPDMIEKEYEDVTGKAVTCQNFGIRGTSPLTANILADILIADYHPSVLIYGTSFIDFADFRGLDANASILASPWVQHKVNAPSFEGWLFDVSIAYRSYMGLQPFLFPADASTGREHRALETEIDAKGFMPAFFNSTAKDNLAVGKADQERFWTNASPMFNAEHLAALEDMFKLSQRNDLELVILSMPVAANMIDANSGADSREQYKEIILQNSQTYNVPVWFPGEVISETDPALWYDFFHLNANGAHRFSVWVGQTLGEAVLKRGIIFK